ncbi:MAG: hypothetical protein JBO36_11870, partial [Candidatus Thiodiazotropha taylori]|nr:hypothetical protein [Candidatus Thiodiazotropha taylori]
MAAFRGTLRPFAAKKQRKDLFDKSGIGQESMFESVLQLSLSRAGLRIRLVTLYFAKWAPNLINRI